MANRNEQGFSLIELLLVVVIIGVIAGLAVPAVLKAKIAAENGAAQGTLRAIGSTQVGFFSQNSRFGKLSEINQLMTNSIGTQSGSTQQIFRGKSFTFEMTPSDPTDAELKDGYIIIARRSISDDAINQYSIDQSGVISPIFP
jgi:type IV pilus assembly protein PilA